MRRASSFVVSLASSAGALAAQWYSFPLTPNQPLHITNWALAHGTGSGIAVFSVIAQRWDHLSPAGSSFAQVSDSALAIREVNMLRGWSAFTNQSATQPVSASITFATPTYAPMTYVALYDGTFGTQGWLRAYSSMSNTWASVQLTQPQSQLLLAGDNVAVMQDGLAYHAYSPYTGQWVTLTLPVAGGAPVVGTDYVAVDMHGTSGPFQCAAFSALRGNWTFSPTYATAGAGLVASASGAACAIRVDTGVPAQFRYVGYSPLTGQWVTSTLTHSAASTQNGYALASVLRIEDADPNARYEIFSAAKGTWQSLVGSGLVEHVVEKNWHLVKEVTPTSTKIYAASALAGGGYQSIVVTDQFPGVATGASQGLVYAYAGVPQNRQVWNYSAVDNMFHGPLPMPLGTTTFANDTASGFIPPGGSLPVVNAMAISVRNNDWRAGPPILAGESWNVFAGRDFVMAARTAPSPEFHLYDPHRDVWQPPLTTPFTTYTPGTCPTISLPGGTMMAYSAHLGTWSSISGIGTITTPGGNVYGTQNFAYFTDSTNQIRVFASPARAQVWAPWPMSRVFSIAGAVAGGATPSVGVSARGTTSQYALLYASLGLPPSPITIPGLAGTLDLDPFTAVQAADLGFFDGDGVSAVRIPIPTQVTSVTTLWFQLVTLDFATMQIELADRASSTTFF